jgi:hypothetical protein
VDGLHVVGRVGTFHVILQPKHIQLMTTSMVHVFNLTPGSEFNPSCRARRRRVGRRRDWSVLRCAATAGGRLTKAKKQKQRDVRRRRRRR